MYGLQDRPPGTVLWLSAIQWFVFTMTNLITVPIVLGQAFGMTAQQTAMFTDRTFFVSGAIGVLQVLFGHRYPIIEGPAGMWWGVFIVLIQMTRDIGGNMQVLQQQLEFGLLIGGLVFILLAAFRALDAVRKLFSPMVTGTFLILLSLQLSKSLIEGVLGIGFRGSPYVVPKIVLLSVLLIALTLLMMIRGKGLIKNLAVLIGLAAGWVVYALFGLVDLPSTPSPLVALPKLFPFGTPRFQLGIAITGAITALILLSNLIASIQALAKAAGEEPSGASFNRGSMVTGLGTLLAGCFGTVGAVPLTAAASLVSLTGIASRLPFLMSSALVLALGFFPRVGQLVSTLPSPVGYAILFTVFGQLLGFGLRDIRTLALDQRDLFVISLSLLSGVGILFVPGTAWLNLPRVLGYLLDNGLIVGVLLVLLLEHVVFRRKTAP